MTGPRPSTALARLAARVLAWVPDCAIQVERHYLWDHYGAVRTHGRCRRPAPRSGSSAPRREKRQQRGAGRAGSAADCAAVALAVHGVGEHQLTPRVQGAEAFARKCECLVTLSKLSSGCFDVSCCFQGNRSDATMCDAVIAQLRSVLGSGVTGESRFPASNLHVIDIRIPWCGQELRWQVRERVAPRRAASPCTDRSRHERHGSLYGRPARAGSLLLLRSPAGAAVVVVVRSLDLPP